MSARMEDYPVGARCDVNDNGTWRTAKVLEHNAAANQVKITFEGWASQWDTWVDLAYGDQRISKLYTKVEKGKYTGDPKNPPDLSYNLQEEENLEEYRKEIQTLEQVKEKLKGDQALDEKERAWLCKGEYVFEMLKAKFDDKTWKLPYEYLSSYTFCVIAAIRKGLTQAEEVHALHALKYILGFKNGESRTGDDTPETFRTYYKALTSVTQQQSHGKYASLIGAPSDVQTVSPVRVVLINNFGQKGGFDILRDRILAVSEDFKEGRKGKHAKGPSFTATSSIVKMLRGMKYLLHEQFMSTYFGSLGVELSSFLGGVLQSLDRNLVYAIAGKKKGEFDDFVEDISSFIRGAQRTKTGAAKYKEMAQLDLILFFIKAPYIVAQRRGMQLIKLYIKALNPKKWEVGEKVTAQYKNASFYKGKITKINQDGTYNVRFDDGDTEDHLQDHQIRPYVVNEGGGWDGGAEPEEDPPKLSFLDGQMFIDWLEANKVIDHISTDPRLFLHSTPIFKFLAANKQLTNAHLDILLSQAKTAEGSKLMSELAEQMDEKTLTSMYKRQTDGIDYADYQPWQLDALTKFTLSAVKATDGAHYYGLHLFWDMLSPENESKLEKEIISKATACLNQLFESELLASKREEYLKKCVDGLTQNSGEVNALNVFQILMKGTDPEETSTKIEKTVKKFQLLTLFFKNSRKYIESAAEALKEKKSEPKKIEDSILSGVSSHRQQIMTRLHFLRFIGQNSTLSLENAEVDAIWELFVTHATCDFDTIQFMKWLPACLKEGKEVNPVFSEKSKAHLFNKLASNHKHSRSGQPVKVTPEWQNCFTSCFLSTNEAIRALECSPLVILDNSKLKGKEQLWDFALKERDEKVRKASQHFLGSMYIKFAHKEMSEADKLKALDEFSTKCMSALVESHEMKKEGESLMQATLELLKSVLERINVGEMIKRPLYKKGEKIQAYWKREGGTLYGAEVKAVNEDGTYHLLYADGDVDKNAPENYLRETSGKKREPEPVKLSAVEQHVQATLSSEKKYFNQIFSALDVGGTIGALAWDLLLLLPPSDSVAKTLRDLPQAPKIDWEAILPPAPVKLLYTLQIIDPAKLKDPNSPLNNASWCKVFAKGGLKRLATILHGSSSQLVADNLALLCLAQIQKIFTWFMSGTTSIDVKEVLATVGIKELVDMSLKMVPRVVEPDDTAVVGKAAALTALFQMLATSVRVDPGVFTQIKAFGPEWEKVVVTALITNKQIGVQKSFTDGINLLCTSGVNDSEDISNLREALRDGLLSVTNARFAQLDTQTNCAQYLMLMRNLIANTVEIESKSGNEIGTSLAVLIRKHPMMESTPKTQDHVLGALLSLTAELIKKVPALQDQMGASGPPQTTLLKPVYDMLFMVPTLQNSYQAKIRPPQCKHPKTRQSGFALLTALVRGSDKNFSELAEHLLPHHMRIHSNGIRPFSWDFEPAWRADEPEREGYSGLVNCGNTCYINAALQQVFMQPKLRENVLAITNYEHPNPQRPKWNKDELEGLQWLLGNLQESNKRAIRPMYFHSRFEDPDWENQGRPVRGEGAAGHAQADSNGFLQTLLGRIEDRIKKTPHKDAIKSVCGLQFADQIVGTRAAPYLNYKYGVDNWVGPISLNVNGHKSLHDCLKSHVEFKQQNRKVSKPGIFGQKYEKSNVQIFKRTVFKTMPQCLMICLNRMGYDNMGNTLKLNHRISFPRKLNMKPYSEEALFGKLPRGSDTGASAANPDSKLEIGKPSEHPDEYYQYELMGIIVHAGRTLQSGHYYSYIRERGDSAKWYCFNDSSISPFDPDKLEEETFGSADTDSWKCSTAYVLFYDKVPPSKKVTLAGAIKAKTGFAGAAMLIAKMKKTQKEAIQKVKARAPVPQGMLRRIWDENEIKWRDSNAHDPSYGIALWQMLQSFTIAHPSPPKPQPDVEKVSDTPSCLHDKITRLVTRYLFMTLARSGGRAERGWKRWINGIKKLYEGNIASSVWLASMFLNPKIDWFTTLIMAEHDTNPRSPVQEVRMGAVEVLAEAMRTLTESEKRAIGKASASSNIKARIRSVTPKRFPANEMKGKTLDEKKGVESKEHVPEKVAEIIARPVNGFVLTIVERLLDEIAQGAENNNLTAHYHLIRLLGKFGSFSPECVKFLRNAGLAKELIVLVDPAQENQFPDSVSDQLPDEYFSLLLNLITDDGIGEITEPFFIKRLLFEGYTKARAKPIQELLCKLVATHQSDQKATEDATKTLDTILSCVAQSIERNNHEITRPHYRILAALVEDNPERAPKIMGTLCAAYTKEMKFKEGDFIAEHIIRFAKRFPSCAQFLKVARVGVERIVKFLKERPQEKKIQWKKGDQVVAMYRNERGVYPGEIKQDNGDDTYYIQYDDGDVWEKAPANKIRPRLFPKLDPTEGLDDGRGLGPNTIKALQYTLRIIIPSHEVAEPPQITGELDALTVNALHAFMRIPKTVMPGEECKLDRDTIVELQKWLNEHYVEKQKHPLEGFPDHTARLIDEEGTIGRYFIFDKVFVPEMAKWQSLRVLSAKSLFVLSLRSEEIIRTYFYPVAKKDLSGSSKKHEAERRERGYHKKGRRYTITCEFAPYGRPVKEKIAALIKIAEGGALGDAYPFDSEDERNERKFVQGQKIDVYGAVEDYYNFSRSHDDSQKSSWKPATVQRVEGDMVTIKFDRGMARKDWSEPQPPMVNNVHFKRRRAQRFLHFERGDPNLVSEQGRFSSLKEMAPEE